MTAGGGYCMCNLDQGFYFIQIKKGGDALYSVSAYVWVTVSDSLTNHIMLIFLYMVWYAYDTMIF